MGKTVTVTCDACETDLSVTGNAVDYRLLLQSDTIPSAGGFVTLMRVVPPAPRPFYFCGIRCLEAWVDASRSAREAAT